MDKPEPDKPEAQADDDTPDSWRALVTEYPGKLLAEFLGRAEVRAACINGAKDWGCPGYIALPAYGALVLAAKLLANQSSDSALSFVEKWIVRFPLARGMLTYLSKTHADLADKEAVRRHLIDELGAGTQASGIEVDYSLSLELAQHLSLDQQLKALAEDIDDLRRIFPELAADALRAVLQDEKQPVLGWIEQSGESQSGAARITYNSGLFGFFGREEQIRTLRDFCHEVEAPWQRFSWTLITGGGGMGKTRLAYEFTRNHLRKGWNAGALSKAEAKQFDPSRFRPNKPTLLVIDYPAGRPTIVGDLLASLKLQSQIEPEQGGYAFPVRVLLLERDTQGNWFSEMLPTGSDGNGVRSVYWGPDWAGDGIGWELPLLHPQALVDTMYNRLHEAGVTDLPEPQQLFDAALKVDSYPGMFEGQRVSLPRPLFAAATAEALVAARAEGKDWAAIVNTLDRTKVLGELIQRDREKIWSKIGEGCDWKALSLHENLLLLATFGLGLNREARAKAMALTGDVLPESGLKGQLPIDHDLLHAMSGGDAGTTNPLEPDILGEYYVLTRLQQLDHDESMQLLSASLAVNGKDAHIFILRCLRDFPALLAQLNFLAPAGENAAAALTFARAAVDLSYLLGETQDWQGLDAVMESVASLVNRWPDDREITLCQAKAAVNVSGQAGAVAVQDRDWTRVEAMLALLAQLRADWSDDREIAFCQAKAAVNVSNHAGAAAVRDRDWTRVEAMLALLAQLRADWSDDREIALRQAQAAVNVSNHAGVAAVRDRDWTRVEAMLALLAQLRSDWPDDREVALEQAKAAFNVSNYADAAAVQDRDWTRAEAMLALLAQLRADWPEDREIALEQAKAAVNVSSHAGTAAVQDTDLTRVEAMLALLAQLRGDWPDDRQIALCQAQAAVNVSNHAGAASVRDRDWTRVEAMLALLAQLRADWPDDREIALCQAKAAVNVSNHAGAAAVRDRDWTRVEAMLALLAQLRADLSDDREIALRQAKVAFNVSNYAGVAAVQDEDWTQVEAMLALLAQLRSDWPDDWEIALEQAQAAFNVSNDAGDEAVKNGDWTRVEAMEALAVSLLNDAHWPEALILVAHNALILASWHRARGDVLVPGESLDRALRSVDWLLTHLNLEDANRSARQAFQLIRAAHQRFPDDEAAAALYRWVEDAGADWSQLPPIG